MNGEKMGTNYCLESYFRLQKWYQQLNMGQTLHNHAKNQDRKITIKPCDKGAGIIVLDFEAYMEASNKHLNSKTSKGEPFYTKIEPKEIDIAKQNISNLVQEMFDNRH